jgi:putative transposase
LLADFNVQALEDSLPQWGKLEIFNTDQGSQFTSRNFTKPLLTSGIKISMDAKGRALDNIFIERFWRTIKYEHLYLRSYADGRSLHKGLTGYLHFYNQQRKHESLNYQTPAKWYGLTTKGKENPVVVPSPPS